VSVIWLNKNRKYVYDDVSLLQVLQYTFMHVITVLHVNKQK